MLKSYGLLISLLQAVLVEAHDGLYWSAHAYCW